MKIKKFNERLKSALLSAGLRPVDLANRLDTSRAIVSQYLNGKFTPNQGKISELAKILNVNEVWLMGYDVPMNEEIEEIDEVGFLEMLDIWLADNDISIEIKRQALDKLIKYFENEDKAYEK